jgi:hypothetical protein
MTQVTLWRREPAVGLPGEADGVERIAVTYSTTTIPPRSILTPLDAYRPATDTERVANPRLRFYPKDKAAEDSELNAIREGMDKVAASAPSTLEVP